jgi:uncharacterized protein DUF6456
MSDPDAERMRALVDKLNHNRMLRILSPLVHRQNFLSQAGDNPQEGYCYASGKSSDAPFTAAIAAADVSALLAQDLIERCSGGYRISAAGRAWLKRAFTAGDKFQAQHATRRAELRETENGRDEVVVVNDAESPLAWLARRKDKSGTPLINPYQYAAGERLRADYTYGALTPRMTASYNPSAGGVRGGNSAGHINDTTLAARQRVARALTAVGPELSGVLIDVCCQLKGLEEAERGEGWPQRSGKVVLQIALTRLARHYGLISDAQISGGLQRRLQHWGADGYRPRIEGDEPQDTAEAS